MGEEQVAVVEDRLKHGPIKKFDQVFYIGELYDIPAATMGRVLHVDEEEKAARVAWETGWVNFCALKNLVRA